MASWTWSSASCQAQPRTAVASAPAAVPAAVRSGCPTIWPFEYMFEEYRMREHVRKRKSLYPQRFFDQSGIGHRPRQVARLAAACATTRVAGPLRMPITASRPEAAPPDPRKRKGRAGPLRPAHHKQSGSPRSASTHLSSRRPSPPTERQSAHAGGSPPVIQALFPYGEQPRRRLPAMPYSSTAW